MHFLIPLLIANAVFLIFAVAALALVQRTKRPHTPDMSLDTQEFWIFEEPTTPAEAAIQRKIKAEIDLQRKAEIKAKIQSKLRDESHLWGDIENLPY